MNQFLLSLRNAQKALKARGIRMVSPGNVEAAYIAEFDPNDILAVKATPGFVPVGEYGTRTIASISEIGSIEVFRMLRLRSGERIYDLVLHPRETGLTKTVWILGDRALRADATPLSRS